MSGGRTSGARLLLCQAWDRQDEGYLEAKKQRKSRWILPNYGMVLLATLAKNAGHKVKLLDAEAELVMRGRGKPEYILDHRIPQLVSDFHPDIVGISCISARWPEAYRMASVFDHLRKSKKYNFKLILGGFHPTSQYSEVFQQAPFIDWLHIGESEKSLLAILAGQDPQSVPGIAWKDQDRIQYTSPQSVDIESLAFPDWNLIDQSYYFSPKEIFFYPGALRVFPLFCSRGCVYRCAFCTYKYQGYQKHSAKYVGEYLHYLCRDYQPDALFPYDSFLAGEHLRQICGEIMRRGFHKKVMWGAALRANAVDKDDLVALKEANCAMTFYGFESGSNRMLMQMNKATTVEDGLRVARYNHEVGLPFDAMMLFGYPQEELGDVQLSQEFLKEIRPHAVVINVFVPMPGSAIFDELKNEGRIQIKYPEDYRRYSAYGALGHVNFTAMDDQTYQFAYNQLVAVGSEVSSTVKEGWVWEKFLKALSSSESAARLKADIIRHYFGLREREFNPSAEIPGFEAGDECCVASGGNPRVSKRTAYNIVTKKKGAPDFSPGGSTKLEQGVLKFSEIAFALCVLDRLAYKCRHRRLMKMFAARYLYFLLLGIISAYVRLSRLVFKHFVRNDRVLHFLDLSLSKPYLE